MTEDQADVPTVAELDRFPRVSLVDGAIGRSLADTLAERYRRQLDELWRDVLDGLPDD